MPPYVAGSAVGRSQRLVGGSVHEQVGGWVYDHPTRSGDAYPEGGASVNAAGLLLWRCERLMTTVEACGWVSLLMGAFVLVQGILIRSGIRGRVIAENYRDATLPPWKRNGPFALIPGGVAFVLGGLAAITSGAVLVEATIGLVAAAILAGIVYMDILLWPPPDWSKPLWLREAEATGWRNYRPESSRIGVVITAILAITTFGAIAVIMATSFRS